MRKTPASVLFTSISLATTIANAQGLPEAVVGKPAALLANGGFDAAEGSRPLGWTIEGNTADVKIVNRVADRAAGLASLEVTGDASAAVVVRSRRTAAVAGASYSLAAKVKPKRAAPASVALEFWSSRTSGSARRTSSRRTRPSPARRLPPRSLPRRIGRP